MGGAAMSEAAIANFGGLVVLVTDQTAGFGVLAMALRTVPGVTEVFVTKADGIPDSASTLVFDAALLADCSARTDVLTEIAQEGVQVWVLDSLPATVPGSHAWGRLGHGRMLWGLRKSGWKSGEGRIRPVWVCEASHINHWVYAGDPASSVPALLDRAQDLIALGFHGTPMFTSAAASFLARRGTDAVLRQHQPRGGSVSHSASRR
jgi:hypothetical protein